jgi:predicted signal transduction protein with EAL and GGDEF domain/ActR/RegA family two-component response regulator
MSGDACSPVLIADDDEISRLFIVEALEQSGFSTVAVADGAAALELVTSRAFSLALLDVDMPRLDGYQVCRAIRATAELKYLPVVMITGHDDAESITRTYQAGATDFIAKPVNWTLLPHRLRYILGNADADRQLRYLAFHDPLTGLPNSHALTSLVSAALDAAAPRTDEGVALLEIGVPACTRIRSIFGNDAADEALKAFAQRLIACIADRPAEPAFIARIEGDRFVLGLRGKSVRECAAALSQQIFSALDEPVTCGDHQFFLAPVIGIALNPVQGCDAKTLITNACAARHHALGTAATAAVIYSDKIGDQARERLALEAALRVAVRDEQLFLHFQPKIRICDGSLAGVEALLRWVDPDCGEVSPARFIPLAEESGLILDIGRWVTQAACRQLMNWQNAGFETSIAINVSARQFLHDDPAGTIKDAALAAGIDPRLISVEITESALIGDLGKVQSGLLAIRELGCRIAVDDFGTGYSSLAYLKGLSVDELKVDQSFIRKLGIDRVDAAICSTVLSLARNLGLTVTAEGVETDAQLEWLRAEGCDVAQGYLIGRPMPARQIFERYAVGKYRGQGSLASLG